jgi:VPDSG-CTERM motif
MKTLILSAIRCCLMFLVTASLFSVRPAQAGYIVTLQEVGSNVVATGSGAIDLTGLSFFSPNSGGSGQISPANAFILTGSGQIDLYTAISGPSSFGAGGFTSASTSSGSAVGISVPGFLFVPLGYTSNTSLSDSSTYNNATFASLGVTPGTSEWTWGMGADQNFTLQIVGTAPVPDQGSTCLLLTFGLLGLVMCRRQLLRGQP